MRRIGMVAVGIILLTVQTLAATLWVRSFQIADDDAGQAVILARSCIELGQCEAKGPRTTLLPLHHGASWIRLIGYSLECGAGVTMVQNIVLILLGASAAVVFLLVARFVSLRAALLSALLYVAPMTGAADFPTLVNSNLLPLPLALYYTTVAFGVGTSSSIALATASLFLAGALSANLSCVVLVPFHLAVVVLCARRPLSAGVAASVVLITGIALEFSAQLREVLELISRASVMIGFLALLLVTIYCWPRLIRDRVAAWRIQLAARPGTARVRDIMRLACGYVSTVMWIGCLATGYAPAPPPRFLALLVIPAIYLVLDASERLSIRAAAVLGALGLLGLGCFPFAILAPQVWGVVLVVASGATALRTGWWALRRRSITDDAHPLVRPPVWWAFATACITILALVPNLALSYDRQVAPAPAAAALTNRLYGMGLEFPDVFSSLQLPWFGKVLPLIAASDPMLFGPEEYARDTGWSLLTILTDTATAARTDGVIATVPVGHSRSAIAVRSPSYLDRMHMRTCLLEDCAGEIVPANCSQRQLDRPLRHEWPYLDDPRGREWARCIIFSIPLHTPGTGIPHIVRVVNSRAWDLRVRQVTGVDYEGHMPGSEVRLLDSRESVGSLDLALSTNDEPFRLDEPPLVEVTAANEHLLAPFRDSQTPFW